LERKKETIAKEILWRKKKIGSLVPGQHEKITAEVRQWVENGIKATTNKRLTILRAMFNHLVHEGKIHATDVPSFPILSGVDNKRRGFLEKEDLPNILNKMTPNLRPIVQFIYETGMRSGAAENLTWDMVDKSVTELHIPGNLLKNGEDLVLPLVDKDGKALPCFENTARYLRAARRGNGPLFDSTDLRGQWRLACDELGYGMFDKKTRAYRGLKLHDFRRSACRNMTKWRVPQVVAMAISGHKTDSIFKRYAITDKATIQEALAQAK
jgi:integrase